MSFKNEENIYCSIRKVDVTNEVKIYAVMKIEHTTRNNIGEKYE